MNILREHIVKGMVQFINLKAVFQSACEQDSLDIALSFPFFRNVTVIPQATQRLAVCCCDRPCPFKDVRIKIILPTLSLCKGEQIFIRRGLCFVNHSRFSQCIGVKRKLFEIRADCAPLRFVDKLFYPLCCSRLIPLPLCTVANNRLILQEQAFLCFSYFEKSKIKKVRVKEALP